MKEIWKDIVGYEGLYEISNLGRVKSYDRIIKHSIIGEYIKKGKDKVCMIGNHGYGSIKLTDYTGNSKKKLLHRLVAKTFIPNPENKRTVNHKDGNKLNNSVDNLEWATDSEQQLHAFNTGLSSHTGQNNPSSKMIEDEVRFIRESNLKGVELAKMFNISPTTISSIRNKKIWKHI